MMNTNKAKRYTSYKNALSGFPMYSLALPLNLATCANIRSDIEIERKLI